MAKRSSPEMAACQSPSLHRSAHIVLPLSRSTRTYRPKHQPGGWQKIEGQKNHHWRWAMLFWPFRPTNVNSWFLLIWLRSSAATRSKAEKQPVSAWGHVQQMPCGWLESALKSIPQGGLSCFVWRYPVASGQRYPRPSALLHCQQVMPVSSVRYSSGPRNAAPFDRPGRVH